MQDDSIHSMVHRLDFMVLTVIVLVLVMELLSLILNHGIREEATLCRYV
jgi:hypothetical protein